MRPAQKKNLAPRSIGGQPTSSTNAQPTGGEGGLSKLFASRRASSRIKADDITFVFRNLATLIENGVSLPRALKALADERALENCRDLLMAIRSDLETGAMFSTALAKHPSSFDVITVNQIRVGERAGALAGTLDQVAAQREKSGKLRETIIKKLTYPAILAVVGVGVIAFLLAYVVPVFEDTYRSARVPLPGITQTLILAGDFASDYGMFVLGALAIGALSVKQLRKDPKVARLMDGRLLQLPMVGEWFRDIAVLELMQVIGNLMRAGFTLAEALKEAEASVGNRMVKQGARDLHNAVNRGERFSREIERLGELFPPIVSQLVIVGEQTGNLTKATGHICTHLHDTIERRANMFVGVIEPTLTASMAVAVAAILMAIYLPMFDMINTVGG